MPDDQQEEKDYVHIPKWQAVESGELQTCGPIESTGTSIYKHVISGEIG